MLNITIQICQYKFCDYNSLLAQPNIINDNIGIFNYNIRSLFCPHKYLYGIRFLLLKQVQNWKDPVFESFGINNDFSLHLKFVQKSDNNRSVYCTTANGIVSADFGECTIILIGPAPVSVLPQHRQRRLREFTLVLSGIFQTDSPKRFRLPNESFKLAFIRPIIELASHIDLCRRGAK